MTQSSFAASVGRKAVQTFGARIIVSVVSILTGILIARALGPQGKGIYSGAQTLLSIPVAITSGVGAAITYLMTKQRHTIRELFPAIAGAFAIIVALCIGGCAVYAAVHGWTLAAVALALALPPSVLLSWQQNYYVAIDRLRAFNLQSIGLAVLTLIGTATACALRWGTAGVLGAWLTALYVFALVIVIDMVRAGGRLHVKKIGARFHDLSAFGSQSALNSGLGLLNYRVDSLILIALLGLPIFGIYSIAVSIGELLFMIARPVNAAVGREIGVASEERAAQITAHVVRAGFALCVLCALPLAFVAPWLVHLVYGSRFDAAALPLQLLLPGIVAFASAGTFASFFIFQLGRPLLVTILNVVMIAAQVIACFVFVPRFGLAGAAISSSVTYVIGALLNTIIFCRTTGIAPGLLWIPRVSDARRLFGLIREMLSRKRATPADRCAPVAVTGANGRVYELIGSFLRARHGRLKITDLKRPARISGREVFVRADLRRLAEVRRAVRGSHTIVHLGAISREAAFEDILQTNIRGTYNVLEAARLEGAKRVILASTGHVTGFYPRAIQIDESAPPRPDTLYGASKCVSETLGQYYCDKYGLEVICIRIGHVAPQPQFEIDSAIWISPRDLAQLVTLAIDHAPVHFITLYAASDNPGRFWNLDRAFAMGYKPQDSARDWPFSAVAREAAEKESIAGLVQGESFAAKNFAGRLHPPAVESPAEIQGSPQPAQADCTPAQSSPG